MMKGIKENLDQFVREQQKQSKGERFKRLEKGLDHAGMVFAKNVWWPAVGRFDFLHAEYEVVDFKDGSRFIDFVYLREPFKIAIEIDGYGPHYQDATRRQFADERRRQNHLVLDDWIILRFAYDDIVHHPRYCQQIIQ